MAFIKKKRKRKSPVGVFQFLCNAQRKFLAVNDSHQVTIEMIASHVMLARMYTLAKRKGRWESGTVDYGTVQNIRYPHHTDLTQQL